MYAPEPFDVGRILQAEIISDGQMIIVVTAGPIDPGMLLILALNTSSLFCDCTECGVSFFIFQYSLVYFVAHSVPMLFVFVL